MRAALALIGRPSRLSIGHSINRGGLIERTNELESGPISHWETSFMADSDVSLNMSACVRISPSF